MSSSSTSTPAATRITTFGDSLSCGFPAYHPSSISISSVLHTAFPSKRFDVISDGVPGDRVVGGGFVRRAAEVVEAHQAAGGGGWVVLLGGTNDLAYSTPISSIFTTLKSIVDAFIENGIKVLWMTVPECAARGAHDRKRDELNGRIKGAAAEDQGLYILDLHSLFPHHAMPPPDKVKYWHPDGLHFSAAGYDYVGTLVGERLRGIMRDMETEKVGGA